MKKLLLVLFVAGCAAVPPTIYYDNTPSAEPPYGWTVYCTKYPERQECGR